LPSPRPLINLPCSCCLRRGCKDSGCSVSIPPGSRSICGNKYQSNHNHPEKLCDCIIFGLNGDRQYAAPVELKSGRLTARNVLEQLQGGADIAAGTLPNTADLVPVVAANRIDPIATKAFFRLRIKFRGTEIPISTLHCGAPFQALLP
jgi:hypothetical protein